MDQIIDIDEYILKQDDELFLQTTILGCKSVPLSLTLLLPLAFFNFSRNH